MGALGLASQLQMIKKKAFPGEEALVFEGESAEEEPLVPPEADPAGPSQLGVPLTEQPGPANERLPT